MVYTTVRIRADTRDRLRAAAELSGKTMQSVLEDAVDQYLRHEFIREMNAEYADLRRDAAEWVSFRSELSEWDAAAGLDGLPATEDDDPASATDTGRPS